MINFKICVGFGPNSIEFDCYQVTVTAEQLHHYEPNRQGNVRERWFAPTEPFGNLKYTKRRDEMKCITCQNNANLQSFIKSNLRKLCWCGEYTRY